MTLPKLDHIVKEDYVQIFNKIELLAFGGLLYHVSEYPSRHQPVSGTCVQNPTIAVL